MNTADRKSQNKLLIVKLPVPAFTKTSIKSKTRNFKIKQTRLKRNLNHHDILSSYNKSLKQDSTGFNTTFLDSNFKIKKSLHLIQTTRDQSLKASSRLEANKERRCTTFRIKTRSMASKNTDLQSVTPRLDEGRLKSRIYNKLEEDPLYSTSDLPIDFAVLNTLENTKQKVLIAKRKETEEIEDEKYDTFNDFNLEKMKNKKQILKPLMSNSFNLGIAEQLNNEFYKKLPNVVNFMTDSFYLPHMKNKLSTINKDASVKTQRYAKYKEIIAGFVENRNLQDKSVATKLNVLKFNHQQSVDFANSKGNEKTDVKKNIELRFAKLYSDTKESFANINQKKDYKEFFQKKFDKYEKTDICKQKLKDFIHNIRPVNRITKIFKHFIFSKLKIIHKPVTEIFEFHQSHCYSPNLFEQEIKQLKRKYNL